MTGMDRLAQDLSQRIQNGALLLAMPAWHLYPDMEVPVKDMKYVRQNDELMGGAVVTLAGYRTTSDQGGVTWSLPLSRMRYYSRREFTERKISSDTSRTTITELWIVVLGIAISSWEKACPSVQDGCELIMELSKLVNTEAS